MENIPSSSELEKKFAGILADDQYFLVYFIMGTYFAPDLKEGRPLKSPLQRHAEGLPPYNADDLVDSQIKIVVMESVYYYTLRKAEQSVIVNRPLLRQFIHGNLQTRPEGPYVAYPRFADLFPPRLHRHSPFIAQCDAMQSIVFVNNPDVGYLMPEDIERFKRLTGLESFILNRDSALLHIFVNNNVLCNVKVQEMSKLDDTSPQVDVQCVNYVTHNGTCPDGDLPSNGAIPFGNSLLNASPVLYSSVPVSTVNRSPAEDFNYGTLFLPCCPSKEEWSGLVATVKNGFVLTGSAARRNFGPVLGLMDIGESEDSYLFRVSLPGVRRDERDFSCEVETNGRVLIKGVTVTGERTVHKCSQAFEMQSQNLCLPGPFSISFKLPGPVDPEQFHGTFSTDGILEGIALKARLSRS